jgi:energy-coupling factor transporter ATP-binding protein EcfA2/Uma2 family endonuclease
MRRRRIGMIFQDDRLFPHLNVAANIRFGLKPWRRDQANARLAEVAALCGVAHLLDRQCDSLSGGERQRVGLARALAPRPRLLLCDEPVSALDLANRHSLLERLRDVQRIEGIPMIYVTHSPSEAIALGSRLFLVEAGRIVAAGPPLDVLAAARTGPAGPSGGDDVRNVFRACVVSHSAEPRSSRIVCQHGREPGIFDGPEAQNDGGSIMSTMVATPPPAAPKHQLAPEDLLAMPDGGHYELIDGQLKERRVSVLSNFIALEIGGRLYNHCREHDSGWLFAAELGYRCFPWKPGQVRRADVSFIRRERYSWDQLTHDGFMTLAPDLAVEVVSPNDYGREIEEKVDDYLRAGVPLVWVVYPEIRVVHVYRGDGTAGRFRGADELSGEDVLPGFRCKVDDLFPRPAEADAPGLRPSPPSAPSPP